MHRLSPILFVAVLLGLVAPTVRSQSSASSALINQQLDKLTSLEIRDRTLPDVMTYITKQTGVPVDATADVWALLPWGRETIVSMKIENQTLRDALEKVTKRLGLTFVLKDESIELQPMPALKRLGRKSTIAELDAINLLAATPLQLQSDKTDLKTLLEAVDNKLLASKSQSQFAVENRTSTSGNPVAQTTPVAVPHNATLLEALEAMTTQTPATWYPWGKTIVVLPKQDQVRRQLQKEISLRHDGTDVAQVLSELSMTSGVPFRYEPGTFQELAPQSRQIRLVLNATVTDALEAICGLTGLGYQVKDDEVYIWNQTSAAAASRPRDRTIAIMQTETGLQILITDSQCPPDVREIIEHLKDKQYNALRKMAGEMGIKITQPATKPATATPATGTQPAAKPATTNEPPGKDL